MTFLKLIIFSLLLTFQAFGKARRASGGDVYVNGYTKSNGTYVAPHFRSAPNGTTTDNWSTIGNSNPYTGEEGTKQPTDEGVLYLKKPSPATTSKRKQVSPSFRSVPRAYTSPTYPSLQPSPSTEAINAKSERPRQETSPERTYERTEVVNPVYEPALTKTLKMSESSESKEEVRGGLSSRYTIGQSLLSFNLNSMTASGKVAADISSKSEHWDILSFRLNNGGEFSFYYQNSDFISSFAGYPNNSKLNTYGLRLGFLPLQEDFGILRFQGHLGLGAGYMTLRNTEILNSGYTEISGPSWLAGVGLDIIFFRLIGASLLWSGSYGEFHNLKTSDRALNREDALRTIMKRQPTITQNNLTLGLMLNIDL